MKITTSDNFNVGAHIAIPPLLESMCVEPPTTYVLALKVVSPTIHRISIES